MTNMTLSVPDELRKKMELLAIINWSEVAREAFKKKVRQLEILESFSNESEKSVKPSGEISRPA